jgi:hypothetical protein
MQSFVNLFYFFFQNKLARAAGWRIRVQLCGAQKRLKSREPITLKKLARR